MNAKKLIAAVAVLAATGSAFAQGNTEYVDFSGFVSTASRASVKAELAQSAAQGQQAQAEYVDFTQVATSAPRAEIRAALDNAYEAGLLDNSPEYVEFTHVASTRSRDEVRNELLQTAQQDSAAIGG